MKIIWVVSIILFIGCNKNVGKYVSKYNSAGASIEFSKYNKFTKRVGQCGGGVEISKGSYFVKNKNITFNYEKIDSHFYFFLNKNHNQSLLSVSINTQDTLREGIPFLTVRLFDGERIIEGGYTDSLGNFNIEMSKISGQAQIVISGLYYSSAYIDLPKTGNFELKVIFTEKEKEFKDYVWKISENYEIIKFTKDTLILKPMESGHELYYIKKRTDQKRLN